MNWPCPGQRPAIRWSESGSNGPQSKPQYAVLLRANFTPSNQGHAAKEFGLSPLRALRQAPGVCPTWRRNMRLKYAGS